MQGPYTNSSTVVASPSATQRWGAAALFLGCFAVGSCSIFLYPINHDVSWLLSLSGQVRQGDRLYVDVIEVGPPLIVWLGIPFSAAAQLAQADVGNLFRATVLGLAFASICATARLLRERSATFEEEVALLLVLCFAAVHAAGYDFGQREHLAMLFALPYLAGAVLRLQGNPPSRTWRLSVALAASVGFLIKPHFLLVPALVEGWLLFKSRARPDISCYAIAGAVSVYAVVLLAVTPEYLPMARMLTKIYAVGLLGISPWAFLAEPNFQLGLVCLTFALVAKRLTAVPHFQVLLAAAIGFAGSAILQAKGWSYHWYPFAAVGWLLFGLSSIRVLRPKMLKALAVTLCIAALAIAPRQAILQNPYLPAFTPIVRDLGGGRTIILSNTVRVSYPLLTLPGVWNASRLPVAQLLSAAILSDELEYERFLRGIVVEDFVNNRPTLLIVETDPIGMPAEFDFVGYLSQDPAFAREMAAFQMARTLPGFRFYQRRPVKGRSRPSRSGMAIKPIENDPRIGATSTFAAAREG